MTARLQGNASLNAFPCRLVVSDLIRLFDLIRFLFVFFT